MGLKTYNRNNYDFISLVEEHLDLRLKPKRIYQECPACSSRSSFIVNEDNTYKCHSLHCDFYKGGDIYTFFKYYGYTFSEISKVLGITIQKNTVSLTTRAFKLEQVFNSQQKLLKNSPIALNYLENRYKLTLEDLAKPYFQIGYTNGLPEWGFPLGEDRIVFPIRDLNGQLLHLHTRAINSDIPLRWKATSTSDETLPFTSYSWNSHLYLQNEELFLTEGISDGLILTKLGFPTVSILSLTNNLVEFIPKFSNLKRLTVIFDNDKLPYKPNTFTKYKSWDSTNSTGLTLLERLLLISINNPKLDIWCVIPPNKVGIKDVNDWVINDNLTKKSFLAQLPNYAKLVTDFAIEHYWSDPTKHKLMVKSIKNKASENLFLSKLVNDYDDWLAYLKNIL